VRAASARPLRRLPAALITAIIMVGLLAPLALAVDSDGDGLRDSFEQRSGGLLDPASWDTDGDGVIDSAEDDDHDRLGNLGEQRSHTRPDTKDTDGDGRPDGLEDWDGDGRSNARQQDQRPVPPGLQPRLAQAWADMPLERDGCQTMHGSAELIVCAYGPGDAARTVVLIGDSHAMMYMPALHPIAVERGWRLVTLVKSACPPVIGIHNSTQVDIDGGVTCRTWRRAAFDWVAEHDPDRVILAFSDSYRITTARGHYIPTSRRPEAWREGMRRTLEALPDPSRVLVIGDVPFNRVNVTICLRQHRGNMSACATDRESRSERTIEGAIRAGTANKGAAFGTIYPSICTYDPCPLVQGDILLWRDDSHLTRTIVERLTPAIRAMVSDALPAGRRDRRR
jgi:hypothetical protein